MNIVKNLRDLICQVLNTQRVFFAPNLKFKGSCYNLAFNLTCLTEVSNYAANFY